MAQRRKSISDIVVQVERLRNSLRITPEREYRLFEIEERYTNNLRNRSARIRNAQRLSNTIRNANVQPNGTIGQEALKKALNLMNKANSRKFSRNTYMGLTNG